MLRNVVECLDADFVFQILYAGIRAKRERGNGIFLKASLPSPNAPSRPPTRLSNSGRRKLFNSSTEGGTPGEHLNEIVERPLGLIRDYNAGI